jgi:thiol-disulfide isomerase/thioredoxin
MSGRMILMRQIRKSSKICLLEYHKKGSEDCKVMLKIINELEDQYPEKVRSYAYSISGIDNYEKAVQGIEELIKCIPTTQIWYKKELIKSFDGLVDKEIIENEIKKLLLKE